MSFEFQIEITNDKGEKQFSSVRPSHSDVPYRFKTEFEASRAQTMCYGAWVCRKRIIEVIEPSNMGDL